MLGMLPFGARRDGKLHFPRYYIILYPTNIQQKQKNREKFTEK